MLLVKLNIGSVNCPNCGNPKVKYELGQPLCRYCWKINSTWVVKLFLLICLEELNIELGRHVTISELKDRMTHHQYNDGRRTFTYEGVKKNLYNYGRQGYRLVTHRKGKARKGQKGRPATVWRVSKKGVKFKKNYLDRYEMGLPAGLYNKNNAKAFHQKMFVFGYNEKARRIRYNGYHTWAFVFPECFKRSEFQTEGEHVIEVNPYNETMIERKKRIFGYDRVSRA